MSDSRSPSYTLCIPPPPVDELADLKAWRDEHDHLPCTGLFAVQWAANQRHLERLEKEKT